MVFFFYKKKVRNEQTRAGAVTKGCHQDQNFFWLLGLPFLACDFCPHATALDVKSISEVGKKEDKSKRQKCKAAESFPYSRKTSFWKCTKRILNRNSKCTKGIHLAHVPLHLTDPNSATWSLLAAKELRKIESYSLALGTLNKIGFYW